MPKARKGLRGFRAASAEAWIWIAHVRLLSRRLARLHSVFMSQTASDLVELSDISRL